MIAEKEKKLLLIHNSVLLSLMMFIFTTIPIQQDLILTFFLEELKMCCPV